MNDENQGTPTPEDTQPDPMAELKEANKQLMQTINNMKSEFDRKLSNINREPVAQPAPTPKKSLKDLWYEDEDAALAEIERRAEEKALKAVNTVTAASTKRATVIAEITREFPELTNTSDPLTVKANEIYNSLPEEDRQSPIAMKTAVAEAALQLGIPPKSKRKQIVEDEDSFSLGSGAGRSTSSGKGSRGKKDVVTPEMMQLAQLMGLDTNKPEVTKRLEKRAQRSDWFKFRGEE